VFARVTASYWTGPHRVVAFVLTVLLLGLVLAGVYVQSLINHWNAAFFDAIEERASDAFAPLLWQFAGYVFIAGVIMMSTVLVRMVLMLRVREWVSTHVMTRWLATGAYLRLDRQAKGAETPEFRIADDVRNALDQFADLFVGFFTSVLLAITFSLVLAQVGGNLSLPQLGITIPAYFLIGAVLYAFLMSGLASLVGWRLVGLIARKNHLEGVFRYELMCVRENAPAIATQHGERQQYHMLGQALSELIAGWWRVAVRHARVSGIASANAVLVGVFPVIIAMPKYLAGEMSLGALMQLATAFVQVQMALNWIVDNFLRFAELSASANRVGEFITAIEHSNGTGAVADAEVTSATIAPDLAAKAVD
jgi:putative ATP-binding cassette transporter